MNYWRASAHLERRRRRQLEFEAAWQKELSALNAAIRAEGLDPDKDYDCNDQTETVTEKADVQKAG